MLPYRPGEEVLDGLLYRRIPPFPNYWVFEEGRPAGLNLLPDSGEPYLSMNLRDESIPEADQIGEILGPPAPAGCGLFAVPVATFRVVNLKITYEPDYGPTHVGVWGLVPVRDLPKKDAIRLRQRLVKSPTVLVVRPPTIPG